MGNYRGHKGFKTYSHARPHFKQACVNLAKLGGTLPLYGDKTDKLMAGQINK